MNRASWGLRQDQLLVAKIDDLGSTIYIGYAAPGALTADASWKIMRMSVSGTVTTVQWADGNDGFDNIWDNRASLLYS